MAYLRLLRLRDFLRAAFSLCLCNSMDPVPSCHVRTCYFLVFFRTIARSQHCELMSSFLRSALCLTTCYLYIVPLLVLLLCRCQGSFTGVVTVALSGFIYWCCYCVAVRVHLLVLLLWRCQGSFTGVVTVALSGFIYWCCYCVAVRHFLRWVSCEWFIYWCG